MSCAYLSLRGATLLSYKRLKQKKEKIKKNTGKKASEVNLSAEIPHHLLDRDMETHSILTASKSQYKTMLNVRKIIQQMCMHH